MEVVMEIATTTVPPLPPPGEFNFDSNCSSPYITAPSSPQRFNNNNLFFSAPTSPTRISPLFNWDQTPGIILKQDHHINDNDFAFDFSGNLQTTSLSTADDLFHAGKILPRKLPPPPISKKTAEENSGDHAIKEAANRGRERVPFSGSGRKGSRSLSPLRVSDVVACDADDSVSSSTSNAKSFLSFTRKWRLRNFLLFRSASEGRAVENDPLMRKYTVLSKKVDDDHDVRNSTTSFRSSTESSTSGSVSRRQQQQRRGPVSAHELHYTLNRAATEEMKKKTFLPYKQGLLGCLGFNHPQIPRGIASFTRS